MSSRAVSRAVHTSIHSEMSNDQHTTPEYLYQVWDQKSESRAKVIIRETLKNHDVDAFDVSDFQHFGFKSDNDCPDFYDNRQKCIDTLRKLHYDGGEHAMGARLCLEANMGSKKDDLYVDWDVPYAYLTNKFDVSYLHVAALYGWKDIFDVCSHELSFRYIDSYRANAEDISRMTPLHYLALSGNNFRSDFADALVSAGADLNATDRLWLTPLHVAVMTNNHAFVKHIVEKYKDVVDLGLTDTYYKTPLDVAVMQGNTSVIEVLEKAVADTGGNKPATTSMATTIV